MDKGISRRFLLRAGLIGACSCLLPWPALAATPSYYADDRARLLADFKNVCSGAEQWLAKRVSGAAAKVMAEDAQRRFAAMLPHMPDIGGAANRNQPYLVMAGWLAALTLAMGEKGLAARDAGRLLYDLNAAGWAAMPQSKARALGAEMFTAAYLASLEQWAANSQRRRYPGDWVGRAIPGDGKTFDIGYDYSECGAVKYLKSQGVAEVAPYFCLNDFLSSRAQGTGLSRARTIAQGDALCDFRYKRGRPVTQDWDTEIRVITGKRPA